MSFNYFPTNAVFRIIKEKRRRRNIYSSGRSSMTLHVLVFSIMLFMFSGLTYALEVQVPVDGFDTHITSIPSAEFSGSPTSGTAPLEVQYSDESSGFPNTWAWYFGDEDYSVEWNEMTGAAGWSVRNGHTCEALPDGTLVLMGGWNGSTAFNDVWRSTDKGENWTQVSVIGSIWSKRLGHSSVTMPDGRMVIMGGSDGTGNIYDDVWSSTDGGESWTLMFSEEAKWSARSGHSSVALSDGSIVLMGGYDGDEDNNDVWRSTNNGGSWTLMTANAEWTGRRAHTSVALPDDSIVLLGGFDGSVKNDVWRSTDMGASWTRLTASAGWTARTGHDSIALPDGSIILLGGGNKNDVWRSTDKGSTWTEITEKVSWSSRDSHAAAVLPDGSTVLTGGFRQSGSTRVNDVWRWETAGSVEQNPAHLYTEPGIYDVALMVSGSGGTNSIQKKEYISVEYPPLIADFSGEPTSGTVPLEVQFTDQTAGGPAGWAWYFGEEDYTSLWTPITGNPGWSARSGHSSVVLPDGSIVLMGGASRSLLFSDVWRSEDNGETWTQMTSNAEWSARSGHISLALPDGSIVLIGGREGILGARKNDVWRSTDKGETWTRLTDNAPWSARNGLAGVVMPGGTIYIMGGDDGELKNDVWFSTDKGASWNSWKVEIPWSARYGHTAELLANGSMMVLGGNDGQSRNDVWLFPAGGKEWVEISGRFGAEWSGRYGHTSIVLAEGTILLMGGYTGSDRLNDVWRSADNGVSWDRITSSAQWTARNVHTAALLPNGRVVLAGGNDGSSKSDVWALDTASSNQQHPVYTYSSSGTYDVTLQAFNAEKSDIILKTGYITAFVVPEYHARVDATNLPDRLPVNESFIMTLTMLNAGYETWRTADGVLLGAVGNHDPLAPSENWRVAQAQDVPYQETYTYEFELYPETVGTFTTEWQMIKEGEFWFGETFSQEVEVYQRTNIEGELWHLFE